MVKDRPTRLDRMERSLGYGDPPRAAAPRNRPGPATRAVAIAQRAPDPRTARNGNYYQTLQIKPYADPETIRGAYRRLAMHAHPDLNRAPDATQQMQAVNEAYAILRDPWRRATYDRTRFARALQDAYAGVPPAPPTPPPAGTRARIAQLVSAVRCRYRGRRRLGVGRTLGAVLTVIGISSLGTAAK